ncbi:MAG: hypothetical protein AB2814_09605 [Candidatus Sedimenticola endophacoides]
MRQALDQLTRLFAIALHNLAPPQGDSPGERDAAGPAIYHSDTDFLTGLVSRAGLRRVIYAQVASRSR